MLKEFIEAFNIRLEQNGYITNLNLSIPGAKSLLYAFSQQARHIGPVRFENHYLFVDWENDQFSRLEALLVTYKIFSKFVNQNYHVPHAWRLTLPNLVLIAMSEHEFANDVIDYAQNTYFNSWAGGETGQLMLLDMHNPELICHFPPGFKQQGSIPLGYAVDEIRTIFARSLPIGEKRQF